MATISRAEKLTDEQWTLIEPQQPEVPRRPDAVWLLQGRFQNEQNPVVGAVVNGRKAGGNRDRAYCCCRI